MGILSSMITAGSLKIEEDPVNEEVVESTDDITWADIKSDLIIDPDRLVDRLGNISGVKLLTDFGVISIEFFPGILNSEGPSWFEYEFYNLPKEFIDTVYRFYSIWSVWTGEISKAVCYGELSVKKYFKCLSTRLKAELSITLEYNPNGCAYDEKYGIIESKDLELLGLLPPPLDDIIPGYKESRPKGPLERMAAGEISQILVWEDRVEYR